MSAVWETILNHLTLITVAIPSAGAAWIGLSACFGRANDVGVEKLRRSAMVISVATLGAALALAAAFQSDPSAGATLGGSMQRTTSLPWLGEASELSGVRFSLGVDGLGLCFLLLTAAVWIPVIYTARQSDHERPTALYALLLLFESALLGTFAADDVVLISMLLEASTLIGFLLIGGWGGRERERVARKFVLFNLAGDSLVLIALLGLVIAGARMSGPKTTRAGVVSFSASDLTHEIPRMSADDVSAHEYWKSARRWILSVLILGLAIKAPLIPFHTWFPAACLEGPLCLNLALLGAGLRVGTYAFARFVGPFAFEFAEGSGFLIGLVVFGAFHAALLSLAHDDMRKMAAYACLSQAALAVAGVLARQPAAITGAILLSVAGGIAAAVLLSAVGFLEARYGARDVAAFGGIARHHPRTSALLVLAVFSFAGIPGLCGFAGMFRTLGGIFEITWGGAFLGMLCNLITAWALFWMLERVVQGNVRIPEFRVATSAARDLGRAELFVIAPLIAAAFLVGIFPQTLVDRLLPPAPRSLTNPDAAVSPASGGWGRSAAPSSIAL